jgi:hypothetical protein
MKIYSITFILDPRYQISLIYVVSEMGTLQNDTELGLMAINLDLMVTEAPNNGTAFRTTVARILKHSVVEFKIKKAVMYSDAILFSCISCSFIGRLLDTVRKVRKPFFT